MRSQNNGNKMGEPKCWNPHRGSETSTTSLVRNSSVLQVQNMLSHLLQAQNMLSHMLQAHNMLSHMLQTQNMLSHLL